MSLPYAIAARILFGTAGLSAYALERRVDERLHALIRRVSIDIDESVVASDRASIALITRSGERLEEPAMTALGAPDNPLGDGELFAKYDELAGYALPRAQARALADAVLRLDAVEDARDLLRLLAVGVKMPHREFA
jgi:2-methylcitrate dehydratase PrpD